MPSRQTRTLQVRCKAFPTFDGLPSLTAVRLSGDEGMNSLFRYELVMASLEDLNLFALNSSKQSVIPIAELIGQELTVDIELPQEPDWRSGDEQRRNPDPANREITGVITEGCFLHRDARRCFYKFTLRPWMHAATLNQNCRIFQDMDVREIFHELLGPYAETVKFDLAGGLPTRDFQVQYQESDFSFFSRLCEEWGLSYHFLHAEGRHTLVIRDRWLDNPPNPGHAWRTVEFHAAGHPLDSEYLHSLFLTTRMTSGQYHGCDYDYQHSENGASTAGSVGSVHDKNRKRAGPEIFDFQGLTHFAQAGTDLSAHPANAYPWGEHLASIRMDAIRCEAARAQGAGHLRGMVPGHAFVLTKHPDPSANREYLILHTRLDIQESLLEGQTKGHRGRPNPALDARPGPYHSIDVALELYPVDEKTPSYRPPARTPRPLIHGIQAARVVGPPGRQIHTDGFGRIKVHFLWDRLGEKNENSSCWVRVMSHAAGARMGAIHLPRIGDEVVVVFIGGDPDLPMVLASSRNAEAAPPYPLPANQALSGYRSHELGGTGYAASGRHNVQIFDDSPGAIQVLLGSDHAASQLSLGHIRRITDHVGLEDHRGQGFELRTDSAGAIRAGHGLVLTTQKRVVGKGIVLSMTEPLERLASAQKQHETLARLARTAGAHDADIDQEAVAAAIAGQNEEIAALEPLSPAAVPATAPNLVLASAAGLCATSALATHIASGRETAITSAGHTSISAGTHLLGSAMGAIRLMAQKAGMRLIAALADIDIEALQGKLKLLALVDISLTAGRITITAKEEVVINGGGSTTRWSQGGIENATAGQYRVRSAAFSMTGPANQPVAFDTPKTGAPQATSMTSLIVSLQSYARQGEPVANEPYEVLKGKTVVAKGVTDALGQVRIDDHQAGTTEYTIRTANESHRVKVQDRLKTDVEHRLGNEGFRNPTAAASAAADKALAGSSARGGNYPTAT